MVLPPGFRLVLSLFFLFCPGRCQTDAPADDPLGDLSAISKNVLLLVSLLAITLIINNFIQKRGLPIPEAICTVAIGMVAGGLASAFPNLKGNTLERLEDESALEFMVAFIAPIIFAEGYGLKSSVLR